MHLHCAKGPHRDRACVNMTQLIALEFFTKKEKTVNSKLVAARVQQKD